MSCELQKIFHATISQERLSYESKDLVTLIKCIHCSRIPIAPLKEYYTNKIYCSKCIQVISEKRRSSSSRPIYKPLTAFEMINFSNIKIKCKNSRCSRKFSYVNLLNLFEHEEIYCFYKPNAIKPLKDLCLDCCSEIIKFEKHSCIKNLSEKIEKINEEISLIATDKNVNEAELLNKKRSRGRRKHKA